MNTIEILYTTTSIIALVSLTIIISKYITKRFKQKGVTFFKKTDVMLMKIHKLASVILILSASLHGILTLFRFKEFGENPYIFGFVSLLSCIAAIASFRRKNRLKNSKHWIIHHRFFAVIAIITFIAHIALSR